MYSRTFTLTAVFFALGVSQPLSAAPRFPDSIAGMEHTLGGRFSADAGYKLDTSQRESVRLFYKTVFASSDGVSSAWVGNVANCEAGDTSTPFKQATLRRINWFRAMAGVPADVALDTTFNQKAQQAAMMMSANNTLSHSPATTFTCYNATGAEAAGKSNLDLSRNGPNSIVAYMFDFGASNNVVGHRRWLLYPQTRFMGTGDIEGVSSTVRSTNSLWVFDANFGGTRPSVRDDFVAWPPKGYVPYQAVYGRWSISYPSADFSAATVSMSENGVAMTVKQEPIANGYGENTLAWIPGSYTDSSLWAKPAADTQYQVTVSNVKVGGATRSFSYVVTVFDPETGAEAGSVSGPTSLAVGQTGQYSFASASGATAYQWRQLGVSPYSLNDGAESGTANFTSKTSGSYSVLVNDVVASGSAAFHLAQPTSADQTLTLNTTIVPASSTSLSFSSRLGLSSPAQIARVEASTNDGVSWTELWSQAGKQSGTVSTFGESTFTTRTISLASLAGRSIKLRFRYAYQCCDGMYPQTTTGIGWYIDDIKLSNAETLSSVGDPQTVTTPAFSLAPTQTGDVLLQYRAGMYDYFGDWSGVTRVTASAGSATPTPSDGDRVMNWAEVKYPQLFSPKASSQPLQGYNVRAYANTTYLGTRDGRVYFYSPAAGLIDVGSVSDYLKQASADGF